MTTILAVSTKDKYFLASERKVSFDNYHYFQGTPKIIQVFPWLCLGAAGTGKSITWAKRLPKPEKIPKNKDEVIAYFEDQMEDLQDSMETMKNEEDRDRILAITPYGILVIDGECSHFDIVQEDSNSFAAFAVGSGGNEAIASLLTMHEYTDIFKKDAKQAIYNSVTIAKRIDLLSGGDVDIMELKRTG